MDLESKRFTFNIQTTEQTDSPDTFNLSHSNGLLNPLEKPFTAIFCSRKAWLQWQMLDEKIFMQREKKNRDNFTISTDHNNSGISIEEW